MGRPGGKRLRVNCAVYGNLSLTGHSRFAGTVRLSIFPQPVPGAGAGRSRCGAAYMTLVLPSSKGRFFGRASLLAAAFFGIGIAYATVAPQSAHSLGKQGGTHGSPAALSSKLVRGNGRVDTRPASALLKKGLSAVDAGRMSEALSIRKSMTGGSLERKVLAWAIAMDGDEVPVAELSDIGNDLSHWPGNARIRLNIEKALVERGDGATLVAVFSRSRPRTFEGSVALARHLKATGNRKRAADIISAIWREDVFSRKRENEIEKLFGDLLTRDDYRSRLEMLLSKRRVRGAGRIAGKAGATRLTAARAAVERKQKHAGKRLAAVPDFQRKDANFLFSKARHQRNIGQISNAARTLISITPKSIHPLAADYHAREHRIIASDLLEIGKAKLAYRLAAHNVARRASRRIDAEFYAGWIALRKLKDPATAQRHFKRQLSIATTPVSRSRGHYWMGRALEATGNKPAANGEYEKAARHDSHFYGQLAARKIGRTRLSISASRPNRSERARFPKYELVQAITKLESADHPRRARLIYRFLGRQLNNPGELALLTARVERQGDFQTSLLIGKAAHHRGLDVDTLAWPVGAIPRDTRTGRAGLALAYAISRQESTFQIDARSSANALGLMQLLPATARNTARKAGIKYSLGRLTTDAAYNARLGTHYLDLQLARFDGSLLLTFAAYNAGPGNAEDWVKRFGDPRGASLDQVIDWVETIPFSETRNYVQRVMENYQVYKARLQKAPLRIDRDLRRGRGA